jgi:hypothetical protein
MRSLLIGSAVMVSIAVSGCGSTRPASLRDVDIAGVSLRRPLPAAKAVTLRTARDIVSFRIRQPDVPIAQSSGLTGVWVDQPNRQVALVYRDGVTIMMAPASYHDPRVEFARFLRGEPRERDAGIGWHKGGAPDRTALGREAIKPGVGRVRPRRRQHQRRKRNPRSSGPARGSAESCRTMTTRSAADMASAHSSRLRGAIAECCQSSGSSRRPEGQPTSGIAMPPQRRSMHPRQLADDEVV